MFCYKCGNKVSDDTTFCTNCGERLDYTKYNHGKPKKVFTQNSNHITSFPAESKNSKQNTLSSAIGNAIDTIIDRIIMGIHGPGDLIALVITLYFLYVGFCLVHDHNAFGLLIIISCLYILLHQPD